MDECGTIGAGPSGPVLVISNREDLTADAVILALGELGTPVVRLDLADFPQLMSLDSVHDGTRWTGYLRGEREIQLEQVRAVYWRRPGVPLVPADLSEPEREWATREATAGLVGVLTSLGCLYVNHPDAVRIAGSKPLALAVAAGSGLDVPVTFVGNDLRAARVFAHQVGTMACKPLIGGSVIEDGRHVGMHTRRIDASTLDESVTVTAHQFQPWIDKAYEVRLTIVGDELFAARIDAHSEAAREDFRADYAALSYQTVDVPVHVRAGVLRLMRHFGLVYAALDLMVDREGWWWLVDVNPAGQYGWIEAHCPELRISAALAEVLTKGAA